jgi:hypothetical protein
MPDLQTELSKALTQMKFDDGDEPQQLVVAQPEVRNRSNFGRVFDFLKTHPMSSYSEVNAGISFGDSRRVSAILKMLFDRGIVSRSAHNGLLRYSTAVDTYIEYDRNEALLKAQEARRKGIKSAKAQKKKQAKVAKVTAPRQAEAHNELPKEFDAKELVASLPLHKAKAIYIELKAFFEV